MIRQLKLTSSMHLFSLAVISTCVFMSSCGSAIPTPDTCPTFERAKWVSGPSHEVQATMGQFTDINWRQTCWVPDAGQEQAHKLLATRTWVELNPTEAVQFGYDNQEASEGLIILLRGVEVMGGTPEDRHAGTERVEISHKNGIVSVIQRVTRNKSQCSMLSRAALTILPEEPKQVYSWAMYATTGGIH